MTDDVKDRYNIPNQFSELNRPNMRTELTSITPGPDYTQVALDTERAIAENARMARQMKATFWIVLGILACIAVALIPVYGWLNVLLVCINVVLIVGLVIVLGLFQFVGKP